MLRGRIGGATMAALGGLLLACSAVVPRWWHGPIQIAGKVIHGKTVHISLLRVSGCNAGDGTCVGLDVDALFRAVTLTTLAITGVTVVLAALLAHASWRAPMRAPGLARGALLGAAIAVVGGVATIVTLPARFEEIPVGGGAFAFFGGAVAVVVASFTALLRRSVSRAAEPPVDVREILSTDMLAPSSLGRHGAIGDGGVGPAPPRFRPWYEAAAAAAPSPAASSSGFAAAPPTEPGLPPGTAPGLGGFPAALSAPAPAPSGSAGERWQTEASAGPTRVGVPLGPAAPLAPRPVAAFAPASPVHGPTQVGVPVAPTASRAAASSAPPSALAPTPSSAAMIFDVSDVTNPANRLMASRVTAPATLPPIPAPAAAKPVTPEPVEPATQPEPAPAEALAAPDPGEEGATHQVERLDSSDLLEEDQEPRAASADAEPLTDAAPPKRPSLPRVPTATTSASLAALAALSKPAHITMADGVMRKLPPPKAGDITQTNPAPACPTCVAPMGWVEKHRRYYCSQCRVYS